MLNGEDLNRILLELFPNEEQPLQDDFEAWGINPEAALVALDFVVSDTVRDMLRSNSSPELRGSIRAGVLLAFGFGYKCAVENEMRRIVNAS